MGMGAGSVIIIAEDVYFTAPVCIIAYLMVLIIN